MLYNLLPTTLQALLASWLLSRHTPSPTLQFELRHQHGVSDTSRVVLSDVKSSDLISDTFTISTRRTKIHKPSFQSDFARGSDITWDSTDVTGPDVQDRNTLLLLAKMANNAYTKPSESDWYDLGTGWNNVSPCLKLNAMPVIPTPHRPILSDGSPTPMGFAAIYLRLQTTLLSLCLSKARL